MSRKTVSFNVNPLLSGPSMDARARSGSPFRYIPLADIDVDPDQPRRVFDNDSLSELAVSIQQYGVLCPVLVRVSGGGTYRLISGERRLRACKSIGLQEIPAVVDAEEQDQGETLGKQLVENLQREDLSPMERALAVGQLRDQCSLSVREIAARLGLSKSLVQRSLDILGLPDDLQAALIAGAAETKILTLAKVKNRELRRRFLTQLDTLSRDQLQELIEQTEATTEGQQLSHRGTAKKGQSSSAHSVEDRRIMDDIQRALRTKVQIVRGKRKPKQGKLLLEFYSDDDLSEIYRRLMG